MMGSATFFVLVNRNELLDFDDESDSWSVYAINGTRLVISHLGTLLDGGVREDTSAVLLTRILNVEIQEHVAIDDPRATIHVLEDNGTIYTSNVPVEVGRTIIAQH